MKRVRAGADQTFLSGQTVHSYYADTRATTAYGTDGTCAADMADGSRDTGVWGLEGDTYWTRYRSFRAGTANAFCLFPIAPQVMQACFTDGRTAFIQTPLSALPEAL